MSQAKGHTGYSHQINQSQADFLASLYMQSVETEMQAFAAWSKNIRTLKPAYDIGTGVGNVVEELGNIAGWEGLEVTDGDVCEAQDNTADITELQALGWKPKIKVDEYLIQKTVAH